MSGMADLRERDTVYLSDGALAVVRELDPFEPLPGEAPGPLGMRVSEMRSLDCHPADRQHILVELEARELVVVEREPEDAGGFSAAAQRLFGVQRRRAHGPRPGVSKRGPDSEDLEWRVRLTGRHRELRLVPLSHRPAARAAG